jgi:protein-S-isoprenylcysteine O-methyltransferase Ste14
MQIIFRAFGVLGFSFMAYRHLLEYAIWRDKIIWAAEGFLFMGFVLAYLRRHDPVSRARSLVDIFLPLICAVLPFFLIYDLPDFSQLHTMDLSKILRFSTPLNLDKYYWIKWIMIVGTSITVVALFTLQRSFSIMTEARVLVTRGIYRFVSHPMYLGEWITALGSAYLRGQPIKWVFFALFVILQWLRLKNEEKKLSAAFPEYEEHKARCWIRF